MARRIRMNLEVDAKKGRSEVKKVGQEVKKLEKTSNSAARGITGSFKSASTSVVGLTKAVAAAAAAYVALRTAISVTNELRKASEKQERATLGMEAAMKSMGRYSPKMAANLKNVASEIQQMSTFGDEAVIEGQKFLVTYKDITDDLLPRTSKTMVDLAALMGGNMVSAANMLGKASMGMTGELRRVGITVDEAAFKSKGYLGVLEQIEQQVAGQAAALRATRWGGLEALANTAGDTKEALGKLLGITFEDTIRSWNEEIKKLNKNLNKLTEEAQKAKDVKNIYDAIFSDEGKEDYRKTFGDRVNDLINLWNKKRENIKLWQTLGKPGGKEEIARKKWIKESMEAADVIGEDYADAARMIVKTAEMERREKLPKGIWEEYVRDQQGNMKKYADAELEALAVSKEGWEDYDNYLKQLARDRKKYTQLAEETKILQNIRAPFAGEDLGGFENMLGKIFSDYNKEYKSLTLTRQKRIRQIDEEKQALEDTYGKGIKWIDDYVKVQKELVGTEFKESSKDLFDRQFNEHTKFSHSIIAETLKTNAILLKDYKLEKSAEVAILNDQYKEYQHYYGKTQALSNWHAAQMKAIKEKYAGQEMAETGSWWENWVYGKDQAMKEIESMNAAWQQVGAGFQEQFANQVTSGMSQIIDAISQGTLTWEGFAMGVQKASLDILKWMTEIMLKSYLMNTMKDLFGGGEGDAAKTTAETAAITAKTAAITAESAAKVVGITEETAAETAAFAARAGLLGAEVGAVTALTTAYTALAAAKAAAGAGGGGMAGTARYGGVFSNGREMRGYAEGGIASGPNSGYPVMLHGTEAILPLKKKGGKLGVETSGSQPNINVQPAEVAIFFDKSMLDEYLASPRGKRAQLVNMRNDPYAFNNALRGR